MPVLITGLAIFIVIFIGIAMGGLSDDEQN